LLATVFLGEAVQPYQVAGGALVVAGLWLSRSRRAS
jgi:drug/metabolite transporter (DMT)-like permease